MKESIKESIWDIISFYQRLKLGKLGKGSKLSLQSRIHGITKNIFIGNNVMVGRSATIFCESSTTSLKIGDRTNVGISVIIKCYGGNIKIGNDCSINPFCVLYGQGGLTIGNCVRISPHTVIVPSNHKFDDPDIPIFKQGLTKKGITIEDDVWIGAGAKILDGCIIGKGSVIGAGTVLTKSVKPYSIVVGVPGKVVGQRGESKTK
ncbi:MULTISPECIES: acyltransferase [Spirulina sp. CCY15215]|uniref:acyltransferase n=1 Tax=Spirulina sp. CCY15215 TaxID=2767591 RepID=UPI00194FFA9D